MRKIRTSPRFTGASPLVVGFTLLLFLLASSLAQQPASRSARVTDQSTRPDSGRRLALLIGNNRYRFGEPLQNPANDARDLADALKEVGFEIHLVLDADYSTMTAEVRNFEGKVQSGDTALVAYAGHGAGVDDENYLLPIDFDGRDANAAKQQALSANKIMDALRSRGAAVSILILDACRANPPGSSGGGVLVNMEMRGVFVAFAALPGTNAEENRSGRNGLFTKHLLAAIRQSGQQSIDDVFNDVRVRVVGESKGRQQPSTANGLDRKFVLRPMSEEASAVERARGTLRDRGIGIDVTGVKNALMSLDVDVLKLLTAASIPLTLIEEAFRQRAGTDNTTVARRFFDNSSKSPEALKWFDSVLASGVDPNLAVPGAYYEREGILLEAMRAANVPAIKALLERGASPHAYQDLFLTSYARTRFLHPLRYIADDDRLSLAEKQELAKAFIKAGVVIPKAIAPTGNGWYSVMLEAKEIQDEVASKLGMKLEPSRTLCEQRENPICKQATLRTGEDWCSIIAKMPNKLTFTYVNGSDSPVYDVALMHLLNIEQNKAYFLGLGEYLGADYVLVEVSKDASSWTILRFMSPQSGMGLCKKDSDGYQARECWRRIPLRRVAGTDEMRFESWRQSWRLSRDDCSSFYPKETAKKETESLFKIAAANPDDGALPLTPYRAAQLLVRDAPQAVTEEVLIKATTYQISREQSTWNQIGRLGSPSPGSGATARPNFVFEWQKVVEQQPGLARGALLDVFMRPDADWGFVKKEKGWNEQQQNVVVDAFIFSHDKVEGRDPNFAARELASVFKRHLQMSAARAPTKLWFSVPLPPVSYDFDAKALKFAPRVNPGNRLRSTGGKIDLLDPYPAVDGVIFENPPENSKESVTLLPDRARLTANYRLVHDSTPLRFTEPPVSKPGITLASPTEGWREIIQTGIFPSLDVVAFDRQLQIGSIPLDATRAEALTKKWANLRARIFIEAVRVELGEYISAGVRSKYAVLFARVQKIEILGPENELIATVLPAALPTGPVGAAAPVGQPPERSTRGTNAAYAQEYERVDWMNRDAFLTPAVRRAVVERQSVGHGVQAE